MRPHEVKDSIGKKITLNGNRDLGMIYELRVLICQKTELVLVKQCKSGLLQVTCDGKSYSVSMKNVDLVPEITPQPEAEHEST